MYSLSDYLSSPSLQYTFYLYILYIFNPQHLCQNLTHWRKVFLICWRTLVFPIIMWLQIIEDINIYLGNFKNYVFEKKRKGKKLKIRQLWSMTMWLWLRSRNGSKEFIKFVSKDKILNLENRKNLKKIIMLTVTYEQEK